MHPIAEALQALGWTQQQLVDKVNKLKPRRPNGRRVHLSQGHLSSVISGKATSSRGLSIPMAKAIATALGTVSAADILLFERPSKAERSRKTG